MEKKRTDNTCASDNAELTMLEDDNATVYENNTAHASPVTEQFFAMGELLMDTYCILSDPISGGMGSVWRVHHQNWNVDLAMKRPKVQFFQSEKQKKSFIHECRAWIDLGLHPNIVSCYYVREIGGVPTIFSEWMENGSLEDRIQDKSLYAGTEQEQQERLLDIAIQFARGLHYAHEQGLIHQDVKPGNLLLSKGWDAGVADFGLAKARAQFTVFEDTNTVLDTGATAITPAGAYSIPYCSMEQMDGEFLTRRTDIYSWAVSVLEMYVGSHPWANGIVAGMNCEKYMENSMLYIPEGLKNLLKKCMAVRPEERPHTFVEIEAELRRIYKVKTGMDYPRPVPDAVADTADSLNNRALSYLDLGLEEQAERYWQQAVEKEPEHLETMYNSNLLMWRNGYISSSELKQRCSPVFRQNTFDSKRLEGQLSMEITYADPLELQAWCYTRLNNIQFILDHAGLLSCSTTDSGYIIWQKNKSEWVEEVNKVHFGSRLILTENRRYLICFLSCGAAYVVNANSGETVCKLNNSRCILLDVCVHPDSDSVYTLSIGNELCRWSIHYGKPVYCVHVGRYSARHICVRSSDYRIYVSAPGEILMYDGRTGNYLGHSTLEEDESKICLSPDGNRLYFNTKNGIAYYNTRTWEVIHPEKCLQAARSCMLHRQKDAWLKLSGNKNIHFRPDLWISPDGKKLLLCNESNVIELWDTDSWQRLRIFQRKTTRYCSIYVSATRDASVIIASRNHSVFLWDNDKPVPAVPWELSTARNYVQQMSLKQKIEEERSAIDDCIRNNDMIHAIRLLEQAEQRYDFHAFLPLRSQLQQLCIHGVLKDVVEIAAFPLHFISSALLLSPGVTADPKGTRFVAASDESVIVFDGCGQILSAINHEFSGAEYPCFSHSGKFLAVAAEEGILVFDKEEMSLYRTMEKPSMHGHGYTRLEFTPDDKLLFGCSYYGFAGIWDIDSGELLREFQEPGEEAKFYGGFFIKNGTQVLVIKEKKTPIDDSRMFQQDIEIYDVSDGHRMETIPLDGWSGKACQSPDGETLYVTNVGYKNIDVWSISDWTKLQGPDYEISSGSNLCISPDGRVLAVSGERGTVLLGLPDGELLWKFEHLVAGDGNNMAFSPDQSTLCIGVNGSVHLYSLRWQLLHPESIC